jgi:hypothetical protein
MSSLTPCRVKCDLKASPVRRQAPVRPQCGEDRCARLRTSAERKRHCEVTAAAR